MYQRVINISRRINLREGWVMLFPKKFQPRTLKLVAAALGVAEFIHLLLYGVNVLNALLLAAFYGLVVWGGNIVLNELRYRTLMRLDAWVAKPKSTSKGTP